MRTFDWTSFPVPKDKLSSAMTTYLLNRWLAGNLGYTSVRTWITVLHEAANTANSDLAAEAAQLLDTLPDSKQGATQQASFTAFRSSGDGRWSNGNLRWGKEHGLSITLKCLDFGDQLPISPELSEMLGGVTGAQEIRQCVILHLAVALLWKKGGSPPSAAAVIARATQLRVEMAGRAWEAEEALGICYPTLSTAERDCREFLHDNLRLHHDRDFRGLALLDIRALANKVLCFVRISYTGDVSLERIVGPEVPEGSEAHAPCLWFTVHCGHMRALFVTPADAQRILSDLDELGSQVLEIRALGWLELLRTSDLGPEVARTTLEDCPRCAEAVQGEDTRLGNTPHHRGGGVRGTSLQSLVIVSMARELNRPVPSEGGAQRTHPLGAAPSTPGKQGARRPGNARPHTRVLWGSLLLPGTLRLDFPTVGPGDTWLPDSGWTWDAPLDLLVATWKKAYPFGSFQHVIAIIEAPVGPGAIGMEHLGKA
jgi:hypothetical protein